MLNKNYKYQLGPTILLLFSSTIMLFPFAWMVLSSFKTLAEVNAYPPRWIPSIWVPENYITVLKRVPFGRYYLNSIITACSATILTVVIALFAAYALSKLRFPGKKAMNVLFRACMFVPGIVLMIPQFFMFHCFGLGDTYAGIVLPQIISGFTILMLKVLIDDIPRDLMESAMIDGCGFYLSFIHVIVPNSKTAILTAALYVFVGQWGSYLWPLMITTKTEMRTLMIGLKYLMSDNGAGLEYQIMMAAATMAVIPVFSLYLCFEKQLVRSVVMSGIK